MLLDERPETDRLLEVHTERLHLVYDKGPFTTHGLSVQAKGGYHSNDSVWRYGQNTPNLGGTARTLDDVQRLNAAELDVSNKGDSGDWVTAFDLAAETAVRDVITASRPRK